ncbi:MAG: hypothetical protein WBD30_15875, partial [Bacteroidota bacterium]
LQILRQQLRVCIRKVHEFWLRVIETARERTESHGGRYTICVVAANTKPRGMNPGATWFVCMI